MDRETRVRNRVYAFIKANTNPSRDEITATLAADPNATAVTEVEIHQALRSLLADRLIFETSVGTVGGDRFASID
jgi:hypothetical protein